MGRITQKNWDAFVTMALDFADVTVSMSQQGVALNTYTGVDFRSIRYWPAEGAVDGYRTMDGKDKVIEWLSDKPSDWLRFLGL